MEFLTYTKFHSGYQPVQVCSSSEIPSVVLFISSTQLLRPTGPALALVPSITNLVTIFSTLLILSIYPATLYIMPSFIFVVITGYIMVPMILMM